VRAGRFAGRVAGRRSPVAGLPLLGAVLLLLALTACGRGEGEPVRVTIPQGSSLAAVSDSLSAAGVIGQPQLFRYYARLRGADRSIRPGVYELPQGASWGSVLTALQEGHVMTSTLVVPEAWTGRQIAARIAALTGVEEDSVRGIIFSEEEAARRELPGPTLEGYLYPATYVHPLGATPHRMIEGLVSRYRRAWTEERRARADEIGMSEREVVTLASIVEAEARVWSERDTIAAVYRNRLRIGMPLQADPTIQYALGDRQSRLLYAHIDEVRDHPYSTYARRGLPPGPIGSPSEGAIDAVLWPADTPVIYMVARPNGTHIFTRSLAEHNAARREVARMHAEIQRQQPASPPGG
jgi:UPF0755 protein